MPHVHIEASIEPDNDTETAEMIRQLAEKMNAQDYVIEGLFGRCDNAAMGAFVQFGLAKDFSDRWDDPKFQEKFRANRAAMIAALVEEYRPRMQH